MIITNIIIIIINNHHYHHDYNDHHYIHQLHLYYHYHNHLYYHLLGIKLVRNQLLGEPFHQKAVTNIISSEDKITLPCDLLLKSVGYRCEPLDGSREIIPFDYHHHVIPSVKGNNIDDIVYDNDDD
jgi:hypothetical protein